MQMQIKIHICHYDLNTAVSLLVVIYFAAREVEKDIAKDIIMGKNIIIGHDIIIGKKYHNRQGYCKVITRLKRILQKI